jgi:uncharacterized protein (DUF1800 family)
VTPPTFLPFNQEALTANSTARSYEFGNLTNWWVELMSSTATPLREKLVLLLHDQFPTAYSKVDYPSLLFAQNQLFRQLGPGSFNTLTTAVSKDPAMLIWLDTGTDLALHPNENFARELMERFTMGVGNYTQADVTAAARAFTGWTINYSTGLFEFNTAVHDFGIKTVLGHTGAFTGEDVIDIVTHTEASARWVISRIWSWLAYPASPHDPVVDDLMPAYGRGLHMTGLLRAILNHPQFIAPQSLNGLIKQPAEYVVGALRAFGLGPTSFAPGYIMNTLTNMGQQLFNPPTVGGWGYNQFWLSTSNSLVQLNFATTVAKTAHLTRLEDEPVAGRIDTLADMLGLDSFSDGTYQALQRLRGDPPSLVSLALVSPDYTVN